MASMESPSRIDEATSDTRWTTTSIVLNVVDDINAHPLTSTPVNIAQYIGRRGAGRAGATRKGQNIYLADFDDYVSKYRDGVLVPAISKACRPDGFYAVSKGYENKIQRLRIICNRGRLHKPLNNLKKDPTPSGAGDATIAAAVDGDCESDCSRDGNNNDHDSDDDDDDDSTGDRNAHVKGAAVLGTAGESRPIKRRRRTTNRPLSKEEQCTFQLPLFWDDDVKLWYIHENSAGCLHHRGHCRKLPGELKVRREHEDMGSVRQTLLRLSENVPTIEPPTHRQLLNIQSNYIKTGLQHQGLLPVFTRITDLCTRAGSYYFCEEWLKALENELSVMNSGTAGEAAVDVSVATATSVSQEAHAPNRGTAAAFSATVAAAASSTSAIAASAAGTVAMAASPPSVAVLPTAGSPEAISESTGLLTYFYQQGMGALSPLGKSNKNKRKSFDV